MPNLQLPDDVGFSMEKVEFERKAGYLWLPVYTKPLHEFRLCRYCRDHEIPVYLPLAPVIRVHRVVKDGKTYTYRREALRPMLGSYAFVQLHRGQFETVWRSNSVTRILEVKEHEQERFLEELRGLQMLETLSRSQKVEFHRELQVNDRFVIESPREFEGVRGYLVEKRKKFLWAIKLDFLGRFIDVVIDPSEYKMRKIGPGES